MILMDRTASMLTTRATGNTRCEDAFELARAQAQSWNLSDPTIRFAVWSFTGDGVLDGLVEHQGFTTNITSVVDALDDAEALGCTGGSTPIADVMCFVNSLIPATMDRRMVYIVTDGLNNSSDGLCSGPDTSTLLAPPFDLGSWHYNVWQEVEITRMIVTSTFWWDGTLLGSAGGGNLSTIDFYDMLTSASGGENVLISDNDAVPMPEPALPPVVSFFTRGDCTADGAFNIADAITVLSLIFSATSVDCVDSCDANDDGAINVADAITVLTALFQQGAIPFPTVACGGDPTLDLLGCSNYTPCP